MTSERKLRKEATAPSVCNAIVCSNVRLSAIVLQSFLASEYATIFNE
ncbi:hypothetical protein [Melissococcus plutonius]